MTTQNQLNPRKTYTVLLPYQCANTRHWFKKGDSAELLACEAEFLKLSGKITLGANVVSQTTSKTVSKKLAK